MVQGTSRRVFESKNPDETSLNKDGFVGVDPIYQNFANSTDKPLEASEPAEAESTDEKSESTGDETKTETPKARTAGKATEPKI